MPSSSSSSASSTALPSVAKCFNCEQPATCRAWCERLRPGHVSYCDSCRARGLCSLCEQKRLPAHCIKDDFAPLEAPSVRSFSRLSDAKDLPTAPRAFAPMCSLQEDDRWPGTPDPRQYQLDAYRQVLKENTIVNLDTGLGKTLIAVMCIDYYLKTQPDKKVMLCVPTIALASQQTQVIQKTSTVRVQVVEVTGKTSKNSEAWWKQLLANYNVFVGTGQLFKQALVDHAFLRLSDLSLIILDECHNAVGSHPYVGIMQDSVQWKEMRQQPRVLGLTASYLNGRSSDFLGRKQELEERLRSRLWCPSSADLAEYHNEKSYKSIQFGNDSPKFKDFQERCRISLESVLQGYRVTEGSPLWNYKNDMDKQLEKAMRCFQQAGFYGWRVYLKFKLLPAIRERLAQTQHDPQALIQAEEEWDFWKPSEEEARPQKLQKLVLLLKDLICDLGDRCLVFVEQVDDAFALSKSIDLCMQRPITQFVFGTNSMTTAQQRQVIANFKEGHVPILVSTPALEEGLDVVECNTVIRYHAFHTSKAHIQGSGRARAEGAQIFYFENSWEEEEQQAQMMREAARVESAPAELTKEPESEYPFFIHPSTDAQVDAYNCLAILREYVSKTAKGQWPDPFQRQEGIVVECCVPVLRKMQQTTEEQVAEYWRKVAENPGPAKISDFTGKLASERIKGWSTDEMQQHRFAMVAVVQLIKDGHIDEHNMPSVEALRGGPEKQARTLPGVPGPPGLPKPPKPGVPGPPGLPKAGGALSASSEPWFPTAFSSQEARVADSGFERSGEGSQAWSEGWRSERESWDGWSASRPSQVCSDSGVERREQWNSQIEGSRKVEEPWMRESWRKGEDPCELPWQKGDDPRRKDDWWQKGEGPWQSTEDTWRKGKGPWQSSEDTWGKGEDPWQSSEDTWGKGEDPWRRDEDPWRRSEEPWRKGEEPWQRGEEVWRRGEDRWRKGADREDRWRSSEHLWRKREDGSWHDWRKDKQWTGRDDWPPAKRGTSIVPAVEAQLPPGPAKLKMDTASTGSEEKTDRAKMNELLMKYSGTLEKGDVEFITKSVTPGFFQSTVTLNCLGEGWTFTGEAKTSKQEAEHSASAQTLPRLQSLLDGNAPKPLLALADAPSAPVAIPNPKGTLQEMVMRKTRRQEKEDFHYDVVSVDEKFVVKLHLGAHVVGGAAALCFQSSPFGVKTKKAVKDAEEEVATKALQHMQAQSASKALPPPTPATLPPPAAPEPASAAPVAAEGAPAALLDRSECGDPEAEAMPETVKVCLVRPDGKEKSMILLKSMMISELIAKHRPSCLSEELEVVGPGDMVLPPDITLEDCTMVFETDEEVPKFFFRKAED
ncbi:unnamed protein product [Effrenium voratum]|nr:unnamed protein product [Effrenium voratum]